MTTLRDAIEDGRRRLELARVPHPGREAALLLRTLLGMTEAALLAHDDLQLAPGLASAYDDRVARREKGCPAAYLIGEREFYGRPFVVDDRVLIPRPESERLVEIALDLPLSRDARVLEIACGSGCIAATLAAERPSWSVVASDLSPAALAVAQRNVERQALGRVGLLAADLVRGIDLSRFDLVVANPPYVSPRDRATLPRDVVEHEPALALFAGRDGLALHVRLLRELRRLPNGALYLTEHGAGQRGAIVDAAAELEGWRLEGQFDDFAGLDRNLLWRRVG